MLDQLNRCSSHDGSIKQSKNLRTWDPLKLTVIGSSPAWPNTGGAHSGYLLEAPGSVLLDCGPGVLGRLRRQEGWPDIAAIVITHFHLDHWGDLVPWVWGSLYRRGISVPRPELWLPPGG